MSRRLASAGAFVLGLLFAVVLFGKMALDPAAVQWLLISDRGQSFLGWHMARNAPPSFPLGAIPSYLAPEGASLALTDSYPWFSLLMLIPSRGFGPVFQHAGLWLALCYGLLGICSFWLFRRLLYDEIGSLIGVCLILVNPVLLFRRFHLSLCAQWLIVASLLFYATKREKDGSTSRWRAIGLLLLAAGTHPYLAAMVFVIVSAAEWIRPSSRSSALVVCVAYAATMLAALWAFGYLGYAVPTAPGFGGFSANVVALIDPSGWSRILPDIAEGSGQYEGFAYLGLAPLLLIVVDVGLILYLALRRRLLLPSLGSIRDLLPLLIGVISCALFALSSHVQLGGQEILDLSKVYDLIEPLPSVFRASGRFIWPLYYALLFATVTVLWRLIANRRIFFTVVLAALSLQIVDGWSKYSTQDVALMALTNEHRPLRAPEWRLVGQEYREIRLIPPAVVDTECDLGLYPRFYYMPFAFVAGLEGLQINSGHLSRYPKSIEARCHEQTVAFREGHLEEDVIYVLAQSEFDKASIVRSSALRCGVLDNYRVCVVSSRETRFGQALHNQAASHHDRQSG